MWILAQILTEITGKPREKIDVIYLEKHWFHNLFRFYEKIFWRRVGIRPHMAAYSENINGIQKCWYKFFTVEAFLAHYEERTRRFFRRLVHIRVRITVPLVQTPIGVFFASPYLFAIALDNSGGHTTAGPTSTDTISSLAVASTTPVIVCFPELNSGLDHIASCAFNSVNLTQITKITTAGTGGTTYAYFITGQSGTHDIVTTQNTDTNAIRDVAITYTGVNQSMSYPTTDSSTTQTALTGTTISCTQSPTTANSWFVTMNYDGDTTNVSASTNVTQRVTAGAGQEFLRAGDSNGTVSGSTTQTWTSSTSDHLSMIQVSISPPASGTAITHPLMRTGIGR